MSPSRSVPVSPSVSETNSFSLTEPDFLSEYNSIPARFVVQNSTSSFDGMDSPSFDADNICQCIPPSNIPQPSGPLLSFLNDLKNQPQSLLINGDFNFQLPKSLEQDYHVLNEYRAKHIRDAFCFAWAGYRMHAWGMDEVLPVSGKGKNNWGGLSLTLLDSIDTLVLLGLSKEEQLARSFVQNITFDIDIEVSVFETTIRIVGGLLAAYDLTNHTIYLTKAIEFADRLMPAFNTSSGLPLVSSAAAVCFIENHQSA